MTVTCNLDNVTAAIAALNISNVTIKNTDAIPDDVTMLTPILIPQPNNFMSNVSMSFETFGSNGSALMNMQYDLQYVFLYAPAGSGLSAFAPYSGLLTSIARILEVIFSNDKVNGLVDLKLNSVSNVGVLTDPANNDYWGVTITLHVLEFVQ